MKAWNLTNPKVIELQTTPPTTLSEEKNVKVKIEEVLFSSSDYSVYDGSTKQKLPFVFGRNAVGVVSEVFQDDDSKLMLKKMDRVAIEPYVPCKHCSYCKDGDFSECENMIELGVNANGFLQNFVDLPSEILHVLPDNISNEKALFIPYVALGLNVCDKLNLEAGRHIAVFASGKVGIIMAQLLAYYQAIPIFISDNQELLDVAKKLGIFYTLNSQKSEDVEKEVKIITGGRMCKEIVYFTNTDANMKDVYNMACIGANVIICGYTTKESKISVSQIANKHLSINGVFNGCGKFTSAINLLVMGKVIVDDMMGDKLNFDNLDKELLAVDPETIKLKSKIIVID